MRNVVSPKQAKFKQKKVVYLQAKTYLKPPILYSWVQNDVAVRYKKAAPPLVMSPETHEHQLFLSVPKKEKLSPQFNFQCFLKKDYEKLLRTGFEGFLWSQRWGKKKQHRDVSDAVNPTSRGRTWPVIIVSGEHTGFFLVPSKGVFPISANRIVSSSYLTLLIYGVMLLLFRTQDLNAFSFLFQRDQMYVSQCFLLWDCVMNWSKVTFEWIFH